MATTILHPARAARERAGISVEQAHRHMRWSRAYFLAIERGEYPLPLFQADRLARLYGCPVLDLTRFKASIDHSGTGGANRGGVCVGRAGSATRPPRRGRAVPESRGDAAARRQDVPQDADGAAPDRAA